MAAAASPKVSMAVPSAKQEVRYGRQLGIAGRVTAGGARTIRLEHAAAGGGFRPVARSRTGADGSYRFVVKPRRSGSYRAVSESGAVTPPRRVTVVAAIRARATKHVLGGRGSRVRGKLLPASKGRRVTLQVRARRGWKTVDRTATRAGGRFRASFRPARPGRYRVRVLSAGNELAAAAGARSWRVNAYRAGNASWYGPGLYGNKLGCGGTLTPGTVGVANKRLPCGARVTFHYRGRSVTARVVDRGPYVGGREWDLTAGLKARLGFPSTGTVWTTR
ncbi:MAG: septal ring lytic transglycosylase RlpA family protein [Thermoleophilaceae bacterium]